MHDRDLVQRLRAGDESAFRDLVTEYGGRLRRLARSFCRGDAVIEEAVQETWMAVVRGLDGFEGRAPLRSWIFGILVNQARRLGVREHRHAQVGAGTFAPAAPASGDDADEHEPGMGEGGHWSLPPATWGLENPEAAMLRHETLLVVETAVAGLPENQRQVVLLRDLEGLDAESVCNILGCTDTHQRVLLHRGRARIRRALDLYLKEGRLDRPAEAARSRSAS
jgi:RNA polymerase sigma-70 factor (ECF subfamily)